VKPLRPSARARAEMGYWDGMKGLAAADEKRKRDALLIELGLKPRPVKAPKRKKVKPRDIYKKALRRCIGVRRRTSKRGIERRCGKKILVNLTGRPVSRCTDCRVLKFYWMFFEKNDPVPVILALKRLAEQGLIGQQQYEMKREEA
jgi:hypothetical protein